MFITTRDKDLIPHYQFMDLISKIKLMPSAPSDFLASLQKYPDLGAEIIQIKK